jgi:hypothetical protein
MNITIFIPEWLLIVLSVLISIKMALEAVNMYLDWVLRKTLKNSLKERSVRCS